MFILIVVNVVNHGGEGSGFTRAGRTCDQHQPAGHHADVAKYLAHTQVVHGQHLGGDGPEYAAGTAVVVESIDPETGHARHFEREVGFQELLVILALLVIHDVINEFVHLLVLHRRQVDTAYIAVDTNHGR